MEILAKNLLATIYLYAKTILPACCLKNPTISKYCIHFAIELTNLIHLTLSSIRFNMTLWADLLYSILRENCYWYVSMIIL